MHQIDIDAGIFHDGRYDKNPTAMNIHDMINGNYLGDKRTNMRMPYVITKNGEIIIGKRNGNGKNGPATPHPTLVGGKNPEVTMAGILRIEGGKIAGYDSNSGHFRPNIKSMPAADAAFSKLPKKIFKRERGK